MRFRSLSIPDHRSYRAEMESMELAPIHSAPIEDSVVPAALYSLQSEPVYQDISLQEVIRIAMGNSAILRDLGGRIVSQPNQAVSTNVPEILRTDPRAGIDAALSAFDTQWKGALNYGKTENGLRNPIPGSSIDVIQQKRGLGSIGASKIGQSGTRYSVTQGHLFDRDNVGIPPGRFESAFDTFLNFEGRHPLARGGGRAYNAIAGPNSPFGTYNGFWIASIRGEIADDEVQIAMRDYMYNVMRNYWLLRFAYDSLQTRKDALEVAREMLKLVEERHAEGTSDLTAVLNAKEKFLAAQLLYDNAVAGPPERTLSGILGPNGALISGTELGYRALERRLRLLIGLTNGRGGLLRPCDPPTIAPILYDYYPTICLALETRPELRRQTKVIEQRRMEWIAARNLRLPSIDLVGNYRIHGFGEKLLGNSAIPQDSSVSEFLRGDLQDISAGVEIIRPAGNRLAATAERNAMSSIVRETGILEQQQLQISYEVSSALAEVERSLRNMKTSNERLEVARLTLNSLIEKYENGLPVPLEAILEAKKAAIELELGASIGNIDYSIALVTLALARGSLLNDIAIYCGSEPTLPVHVNPSMPLPVPAEPPSVIEAIVVNPPVESVPVMVLDPAAKIYLGTPIASDSAIPQILSAPRPNASSPSRMAKSPDTSGSTLR